MPCYGFSAVVTEMLGSSHLHREAVAKPDLMKGWVDFRRSNHVADMTVRHPRTHALFERHHHDASDPTVVSFDNTFKDGAAGGDGSTPGGSAALVLALASPLGIAAVGWAAFTWHVPEATPYASRTGGRLERPPRA